MKQTRFSGEDSFAARGGVETGTMRQLSASTRSSPAGQCARLTYAANRAVRRIFVRLPATVERLHARGECGMVGAPTERANARPGLDQRSDQTDQRPDATYYSESRIPRKSALSETHKGLCGCGISVPPADRP